MEAVKIDHMKTVKADQVEPVNIDHDAIEASMVRSMEEFARDAVRSMEEEEIVVNAKAAVGLQRLLSTKHIGVGLKKPIKIDSLEESTMPEENKTFKVSAEPDKTAVIDDKFAVKTEFNDRQFTFNEQDAREAFSAAFKTMLEADDIKGDIFVEIEKVKNRTSSLSARKRKLMEYLGAIWDTFVAKDYKLTQTDIVQAILGYKFAHGGQRGMLEFAHRHVQQVFGDVKWEGLPNVNN